MMNDPDELSKKNKLLILIVFIGVASTGVFATVYKLQLEPQMNTPFPSVTYLSASEMQQFINQSCKCIPTIDVRSSAEYLSGHLNRSINIIYPSSLFILQMTQYNESAPIIVYCSDGIQSKKTLPDLIDAGFQNIYILDDGINSWIQQGYAIEK